MKALRTSSVLVVAVLSISGAANAQVQGQVPDTPDAAMDTTAPKGPGVAETGGPTTCPRWNIDDGQPLQWLASAWTSICVGKVRSDAIAMSWAKGQDGHGKPLDAAARSRKQAELQIWLRRMAGKYRIAGKRWNPSGKSDVGGTAECFPIGNGPGVSCVIAAGWESGKQSSSRESRDQESHNAVRPRVLLFGLDPGAMEIRVTHLDSMAVRMRGFLLDDAVILEGETSPEVFVLNPSAGSSQNLRSRASSGIPLRRVSPESLPRAVPEPLSRVAIHPGGDVDLQFHVYPPDMVTLFNQPIEFSLQLFREPG